MKGIQSTLWIESLSSIYTILVYLRNRSALAVNCCIIIHCLEVSCKEDQIMSLQREWFIFVQLTDNRQYQQTNSVGQEEQSDLGHHCLLQRCFKGTSRWYSRRYLGLNVRKPVFCGLQTTKAQTSQPAHQHCLISAFVIRLLESVISKLTTGEISMFKLVSIAETGLNLALSETPKTGFVAPRPI